MTDEDDKYSKARQRKNLLPVVVILSVMTAAVLLLRPGPAATVSTRSKTTTRGALKQHETPGPELAFLEQEYNRLDAKVREIKKTGVIMETDKESLEWTGKLQTAARQLIQTKYGKPPYRIRVDLEFQPSIPDFDTKGKFGSIVIEMAPIEYIPVSVWTFMEVARTWQEGSFHRNAGHVLQATTKASAITRHLPFQEYSKNFPHKKGTTGYCGRPSGPCWYISIQDNTHNHGPGSQQKHNPHEADANFGTVVEGMDDVVPRIHSTPQTSWLDKSNQIFIRTMTILVPTGPGGAFEEWHEAVDVQ